MITMLKHSMKRNTAALLVASILVLGACETPRTFEDAGVYGGENYTITIAREPDGLSRTYSILINGDEILRLTGIRGPAVDDRCSRVSLSVAQCTYETSYQGMSVRVVEETDSQLFQQEANYHIYFDGTLVRRITTPLL